VKLRALIVSPFVRTRLTTLLCKERGADLEHLAGLMAAGRLSPSLDRSYPLAEAAAALRHLEAGTVRGKLAITV
jgi:NADPH:quinone reductase-like Zn-dependent oxidoreductase